MMIGYRRMNDFEGFVERAERKATWFKDGQWTKGEDPFLFLGDSYSLEEEYGKAGFFNSGSFGQEGAWEFILFEGSERSPTPFLLLFELPCTCHPVFVASWSDLIQVMGFLNVPMFPFESQMK